MSTASKTLSMTPADLLKYRNELTRTGNYLPLGRMRTIAIGPCATYTPPANDPIIKRRGRMIDLSGQWLPIAQAPDKAMILVTSTLRDAQNRVALPELADPDWRAADYTEDEATLKAVRPEYKDKVRMIPQRLEDRTNDVLEGTNFLVFQPVLRITYQPELLDKGKSHGFQPAEWKIEFRPDAGGVHCAFLCDPGTGECHFFGGLPIFGGDTRG